MDSSLLLSSTTTTTTTTSMSTFPSLSLSPSSSSSSTTPTSSSVSCCSLCLQQYIVSSVPKIKIVCSLCNTVLDIQNNKIVECVHCNQKMNNDANQTTTTTTSMTTTPQTTIKPTIQNILNFDSDNDHIIDIDTTLINKKRGLESNANDKHDKFDDRTQKVSKIDHETQQQTQQVIDANLIFCQLLMSADLFKKLGFRSISNLSVTSKTISKVLRTFINDHCTFKFESKRKFRIYNPKKIFVQELFDNCPLSVREMTFHDSYNYPINPQSNNVWHSLTRLTFGRDFNNSLINLLPPNLTKLQLGKAYNQNVDNLPIKITHLSFGRDFQKTLDNKLPPKLTHLTLGELFNQNFDTPLPSTLKFIEFSDGFRQPITFPPNLIHLKLGKNQQATKLPQKLTHLTLYKYSNEELPPTLTHLTIQRDITFQTNHLLTSNITHLIFGNDFNELINQFPANLIKLSLGDRCEYPIPALPQSIEDLELSDAFNHRINLPNNLTKLKLGYSYRHLIQQFPPKLVHLTVGKLYFISHPLNDSVTASLQFLQINSNLQLRDGPIHFHPPPHLSHFTLKMIPQLKGVYLTFADHFVE